jgi:hypothetical protein
MNSDKKFVLVFYTILGGLALVLSVFLIVSINSNKTNGAPVDVAKMKTINPDEKGLTSKTQAYNKKDHESILNIEEENVNIDFKRLFKKDTTNLSKDNISLENQTTKKSNPYDNRIDKSSIQEKKRAAPPIRQYSHTNYPSDSYQNQTKTIMGQSKQPQFSHEPVERREGFYTSSIDQGSKNQSQGTGNVIKASVHFEQVVKNGSTVKFRILDPIVIGDVTIPANTFIYGTATMSQERVKITLSNIYYDSKLHSVKYKVYDSDGIEGIYVPGLLIHDVAKETKKDVISDVDINIPYVGDVPVNVARKEINATSCVLTQDYVVYLK